MAGTEARPLALVTGAPSGIGFELAKQFADHGYDLVITAEDDELGDAARELAARGVQVDPIQVDLRRPDGVDELYQRVVRVGHPLDAAALNAGIGSGGGVNETPLELELQLVDLNVRSTVQLANYVRSRHGPLKTKVQGRAGGLVPNSVKAKMHRAQAEPGSRS